MQLSSDETRAVAFIAALIGLTVLGRWVDRPKALLGDQPAVDIAELTQRSEAAMRPGAPRARLEADPPPRRNAAATPGQAGVDLNEASASELERLPGIGPALAGRIVAYRDSMGQFGTLEELDSVKGVGPALLERLKPLLRLRQ